jgi:hypothetical protein
MKQAVWTLKLSPDAIDPVAYPSLVYLAKLRGSDFSTPAPNLRSKINKTADFAPLERFQDAISWKE